MKNVITAVSLLTFKSFFGFELWGNEQLVVSCGNKWFWLPYGEKASIWNVLRAVKGLQN